MTQEKETLSQWLTQLSESHTSTYRDWTIMRNFLRRIGYKEAIVQSGSVRLHGMGSKTVPPITIHEAATLILIVKKSQEGTPQNA